MENNEQKSELKSIRTFQTDIQELEKKGISVADLAAEAEKTRGLAEKMSQNFSAKKLIIISAGLIAIIIIGFGVFWLFNNKNQENQPISLVPKPILVGDTKVEDITPGIQASEFLKTIGADPPAELLDSLGGRFMAAKLYLTKEWTASIFSITNYESAFAGMLKWEKNLGGNFIDKEIQSHDTRESPTMIYSFVNQNYLVITGGEEPLKEVFHRFTSPQYLNP